MYQRRRSIFRAPGHGLRNLGRSARDSIKIACIADEALTVKGKRSKVRTGLCHHRYASFKRDLFPERDGTLYPVTICGVTDRYAIAGPLTPPPTIFSRRVADRSVT
jgi:hypothetical protein